MVHSPFHSLSPIDSSNRLCPVRVSSVPPPLRPGLPTPPPRSRAQTHASGTHFNSLSSLIFHGRASSIDHLIPSGACADPCDFPPELTSHLNLLPSRLLVCSVSHSRHVHPQFPSPSSSSQFRRRPLSPRSDFASVPPLRLTACAPVLRTAVVPRFILLSLLSTLLPSLR